jgi:hypothetical protein
MRAIALVSLLAGCGTDFIGDPSLPPEAQALLGDGESPMLDQASAGAIALLEPPPQGGYVIYVGARARNLGASGVRIAGELHDAVSGELIGVDARQTDLVADPDGWASTRADPTQLANISPCPDYTNQDVHDQSYNLVLTITDREQRTASTTVRVVPRCQLADPALQRDCLCSCSAGYTLGKCTQ